MTHVHLLMGAEDRHTRPVVRKIGPADLVDALKRGFADFSAMPTHAVFLCLIYPIVGILLARLTLGYAILPLLFPLAAGFALLGRIPTLVCACLLLLWCVRRHRLVAPALLLCAAVYVVCSLAPWAAALATLHREYMAS